MDTFYLVIVAFLFILAISDLVVGVSNDAVNFLNSAVGAKAAPLKTIMLVAALGIVLGCTFSSGMMEVARKGIFHPEYFYFSEIMIIFLAVMVTDVILLDTFNSFGMPTSTTVSIVFELFGPKCLRYWRVYKFREGAFNYCRHSLVRSGCFYFRGNHSIFIKTVILVQLR
jgi:phosphate/sulfate permease